LEDRFAGAAAEQDDLSSVFCGDAMSQGEAKASSLLFSLAHKRFKEAVANIFGDTFAVVEDMDEDVLGLNFERHHNFGLLPRGASGLAGIEEKIAHSTLDLLAVDDDGGLGGVAKACHERDAFGVRMGTNEGGGAFEQGGHEFWRSANAGAGATEDEE
jgi:hypothetical protein